MHARFLFGPYSACRREPPYWGAPGVEGAGGTFDENQREATSKKNPGPFFSLHFFAEEIRWASSPQTPAVGRRGGPIGCAESYPRAPSLAPLGQFTLSRPTGHVSHGNQYPLTTASSTWAATEPATSAPEPPFSTSTTKA